MLTFTFRPVFFFSPVLLSATILTGSFHCAFAQSSSEETTITRGVGFRQTNKFEFKYKERIKTYEDQIDMGLKRGWLSALDAKTFSERLAKLKEMEASVSANGYPKPELDNLELEITKFNREFSDAGQKTKPSPVEAKSDADLTSADNAGDTASAKPASTASPAPSAKPAPASKTASTAKTKSSKTVKSVSKNAAKTKSKKK